MYSYNYVFFSTPDNKYKIDRDAYNTICALELEKNPDVRLVTYPCDKKPYWLRFLFAIHNSAKIAKRINLPFKKLWYPYYFCNDFDNKKPLCFVLLNHQLPIDYLNYLKNRYPDSKLVLLHRDFLCISQRINPQLSQNPILDLEMTYDEGESKKYGFPHFSEFESKIDVKIENNFESDVFFAGKAKDRLPAILNAYKKIIESGLKPNFYLVGVPENQQVKLPGINYSTQFMSYREMLYHTVNTRCLLEAVQGGGQEGFTSRFLEAVIYGKKLISNHSYIKQSKFYDPSKIQIVDNMDEIDTSFITEGSGFVDYFYKGEFSPFRVIDRIEEEIKKKFG